MNDTERFNKWVSERMGHPLGVYLGINAVNELTEENKKLKQDRDNAISKMSKSWQHNSDDRPSLISDFVDMANRQFEENKQLREEREMVLALLEYRQSVVKVALDAAKKHFPNAEVTKIKTKEYEDDIPF